MGRLVNKITNDNPERLARVLNAKYRTIGVDTDALQQQVIDKKQQSLSDAQIDTQYALISQVQDKQIIQKEQQRADNDRICKGDLTKFNLSTLTKDITKEWDLNRPDAIKINQPARIGDDDPRCGVASAQKFDGEDLQIGDRVKTQNKQCSNWWQQQVDENLQEARKNKEEIEKWQAHLLALSQKQQHEIRQDTDAKRQLQKQLQEANKAIAENRKKQIENEKEIDKLLSQREIDCALQSQLLSEDPSQAISALSNTRVQKAQWKGMSPEERLAIYRKQQEQIVEQQEKRQRQRMAELQFAKLNDDVRKTVEINHQKAEEFRKKQNQDCSDYWMKQKAEKLQRDQDLKEKYSNHISPVYFTQYGTSHR